MAVLRTHGSVKQVRLCSSAMSCLHVMSMSSGLRPCDYSRQLYWKNNNRYKGQSCCKVASKSVVYLPTNSTNKGRNTTDNKTKSHPGANKHTHTHTHRERVWKLGTSQWHSTDRISSGRRSHHWPETASLTSHGRCSKPPNTSFFDHVRQPTGIVCRQHSNIHVMLYCV